MVNGGRDRWCARLGSNQQPLPSEGSTLSIELRAQQDPYSSCMGLYNCGLRPVHLQRLPITIHARPRLRIS
jgi:hypothetical protein